MNITHESVQVLNAPAYKDLLSIVERAGRTCYQSNDKITETSAEGFIRSIIRRGHEAVLEHGTISVLFVCDRGVTHEIVRHRLCAYCQESTRYCNYSKGKFGSEITVISPSFWHENSLEYKRWKLACEACERAYFDLLDLGCTPEEARTVLPNSLKTELVMTTNIREWRHFLKLRTDKAAHPQMRFLAQMALETLCSMYPVFFEDIVHND